MEKTVYFLIDCSGSMYGSRADAVNVAMAKVVDEAIPEIRGQKNDDLDISFKVIGFSNDFPGDTRVFVDKTALDDFNQWDPIDQSMFSGGTPTGAAINEVIRDLEGGVHGDVAVGMVAPAVILISDGLPNGQNPSYEEVLQRADKTNPLFNRAFYMSLRVALGISVDAAGRESLKKFGRVSRKMQDAGIEPYYDCSEDYVSKLVEILKSATINASVG